MRQHGRFGQLAPRIDSQRFHRLVRPEHLAAARLDTGYSPRIDNYGCLDLTFEHDGEVQIVPYLVVQGLMGLMREASPFIWPVWLPPFRSELANAIEDLLEPWLRSLMVARFAQGEAVKFFTDDDEVRDLYARAQSCGFLGAASTERTLEQSAPYVYALRFASNKRVAICDANGATGAALLARVASVKCDLLDASRRQDARRWFGLDVFGERSEREAFDVEIGERSTLGEAPVRVVLGDATGAERTVRVAQPIPLPVMVSFDVGDSAEIRRFAVAAPPVSARPHLGGPMKIVGGSSGRIGLVVRDDYAGTDDADADAAFALAGLLDAQGFTARVVGASQIKPREFDLLHVFGYRCAAAFVNALSRAGGLPVPLVFSPYIDDPKREAEWGIAMHREALSNAADESLRTTYANAIRTRRLSAANAPQLGMSSVSDPAVRTVFSAARAILASCADEEAHIRAQFGIEGTIRTVPAVLADETQPSESIGSAAGLEEFVLVDGPVDARGNQYHVVRACAELGYPVVLIGSVVNTEYYADVCASLPAAGVWIPRSELSAAEIAGLYRRARVFVDVGWSSSGLYRLTRAAAAGASLVASDAGWGRSVWPGLVQAADPASPESIAEGIRTAWDRAAEFGPAASARTLEKYRPFDMLVATLDAYKQAATPAPA